MRPPNIELIFITNFQIVSLLKIAPYRMPKFGGYRIFSYLCTSNQRKLLLYPKSVFTDDTFESRLVSGAGHQ